MEMPTLLWQKIHTQLRTRTIIFQAKSAQQVSAERNFQNAPFGRKVSGLPFEQAWRSFIPFIKSNEMRRAPSRSRCCLRLLWTRIVRRLRQTKRHTAHGLLR
jgi:hypothetical protein